MALRFSLPFFRRAPEAEPAFPELKPAGPLFLIGDPHGRADLLGRSLDLQARDFPDHRPVILGDMIDRGEDSAGVLALARAAADRGAICLAGNHEAMCLDFLDAPDGPRGQSWLAHGGLETLGSYGLRGLPRDSADLIAARDGLRAAMGPETEAFLRALPLIWQSGNLVMTHAGMDPALPPGEQPAKVLLWGHADFARSPRSDGIWVAHGHEIQDAASARSGRIALDTGAYATGRLSHAVIDPTQPAARRVTLGQAL